MSDAVMVCFDLDRECGEYPRGWCPTCPKRNTDPFIEVDGIKVNAQWVRNIRGQNDNMDWERQTLAAERDGLKRDLQYWRECAEQRLKYAELAGSLQHKLDIETGKAIAEEDENHKLSAHYEYLRAAAMNVTHSPQVTAEAVNRLRLALKQTPSRADGD